MAHQPTARNKIDDASAIFTPFILPIPTAADPPRLSATEKLRAILVELDAQHDAVRRNIIYLVGVEKDRIVREAIDKRKLQEANGELQREHLEEVLSEKELGGLLERLRAPANEESDGSEYLFADGEFPVPSPGLRSQAALAESTAGEVDGDGDAAMGGTESALEVDKSIRASAVDEDGTKMSTNLQVLFSWAAARIKQYDVHAANTRKYYEDALKRQLARETFETPTIESSNTSAASSRRGSGILANKNEPVWIDREAMTRIDEDYGMRVTVGPLIPVGGSGGDSKRTSSMNVVTGDVADGPKGLRRKPSVKFAI